MDETSLNKYLSLKYAEARARHPDVSRRQLKLQVVNHFWKLSKAEKIESIQSPIPDSGVVIPSHDADPDPFDIPGLTGSRAIGTRGIIVRTHFDLADDAAWNMFLSSLEDLERRSLANISDSQMDDESESEDDEENEEKDAEDNEADDTAMANDNQSSSILLAYETDAIFVVIDPSKQDVGQASKDLLSGASNVVLLRLFNDVSITPSPPLPAEAPKRIKPGHRLIDDDGYREVYSGPRIWVWDQRSAQDQTVRLVSSQVFVYGDATADSWRAKAAHMWDLQVNMDAGMRIDFSGGVGLGWDINERARNLKESLV